MNYYLAIDIGASSGRHILGWIDRGRLFTEEIYRFPNAPLMANNRLVWNAGRLFADILKGLARAKELGKIPVSVGIDTWAVDYVLGGGKHEFVSCYRDPGVGDAVPAVHARIPQSELYSRTGIQFQPFNTIYRLYADTHAGNTAGPLLMLPEYFNYLLTGVMAAEYTNATSTGLVNARTRTWDKELLERLEIPSALFLPLHEAGERVGRFTPEIQRAVGYDAEVVLPATHDTASSVVAALALEGTPYLSSGTWSLLGVVRDTPETGERARTYNYTNEGHIGGKYRLQKNVTGMWIVNRLRSEMCPKLSFSELTERARRAACRGIVDVNDARFTSPKSMKEEFEGALGCKLTAEEAVRSALESLADGYRRAVEELSSVTGERYGSINIIGGGSKNTLLNELTKRATGLTVKAGPAETTAMGNLIMQFYAGGEISDLSAARILIENSFEG